MNTPQIPIKSLAEIEIMAQGGQILAEVLKEIVAKTSPGVSKKELDELAKRKIELAGGKSGFLGFRGFPATLCVCRNNELVHSIPDDDVIQEGDVVCLDLGVKYHDFYTDAAVTIGIGEKSKKHQKLIDVCRKALNAGIDQMKPGNKISDMQSAIVKIAQEAGFYIVEGLTGHGIGRKLQEYPAIANKPGGIDFILKPGMTFALEPMMSDKSDIIKVTDDGWTVIVARGIGVHFEHTVAVTKTGCRVLTS